MCLFRLNQIQTGMVQNKQLMKPGEPQLIRQSVKKRIFFWHLSEIRQYWIRKRRCPDRDPAAILNRCGESVPEKSGYLCGEQFFHWHTGWHGFCQASLLQKQQPGPDPPVSYSVFPLQPGVCRQTILLAWSVPPGKYKSSILACDI